MFTAEQDKHGNWRVKCDGRDICGAINEAVARETAAEMNAYRARNP